MRLVRTENGDVNALQENVYDVIRKWEGVPLLDGALVEAITLGTSAVDVPHGLGRPIRGWIVVRTNGTATIYEPSTPALRDRFLRLQATGTVVVTLWVF